METILVIDDEEPLRMLISSALQSRDFDVLEAENGMMGIEMAHKHLPDLIICDVVMPKLDGYATLAELNKDPLTAGIPCILMTGRPDSAGMRQGMNLGADDYLTKPFTIPELFSAVDARLRKKKMLRELAEKRLADLRASISLALPHELFTPLSGILGFAEVLSGDISAYQPEEISEMGQAILTSGKRLYRLIENFLIFAQIELICADPNRMEALRLVDCTITQELLQSRAEEMAITHNRRNDTQIVGCKATICIQEDYFRKVIDELLDNAFKFSQPGTPVAIHAEVKGNLFYLRIADRGRGMNSENVANIGAYMQFERKFYEQQGSGLGLSITSRLVEIHGGKLDIQSEPNNGTTIIITLPTKATVIF